MTTFQSLIKHPNLKSLVNSLNIAQKQNPLPFFVLKISNRTPFLPEHSSLSLSLFLFYLEGIFLMRPLPGFQDHSPSGVLTT